MLWRFIVLPTKVMLNDENRFPISWWHAIFGHEGVNCCGNCLEKSTLHAVQRRSEAKTLKRTVYRYCCCVPCVGTFSRMNRRGTCPGACRVGHRFQVLHETVMKGSYLTVLYAQNAPIRTTQVGASR